jgi:hypothetical protein
MKIAGKEDPKGACHGWQAQKNRASLPGSV